MRSGYNTETTMPRGLISGFDYRIQRAVTYTRRQWITFMKDLIAKGGTRIVHDGETMVTHRITKDKVQQNELAFEVYAILPKVA